MDKLIEFFTNFNNNILLNKSSKYNTIKNNIKKIETDKIDLEQKFSEYKQKEEKLEKTIDNIKIELKEIINSMIPNKITDDNIDMILSNFDLLLLNQKIRDINDEYNKVSKEQLLKNIENMEKNLGTITLAGGNVDSLLDNLEKLKNDKLLLVNRLLILTKKVIKINELYQKVLSQNLQSKEIEDLNEKLTVIVNDVNKLNKIQTDYKNLKKTITNDDGYLNELKRLNTIIESNSITNLITKVDEANNVIKPIVAKIVKSDEFIKNFFKPDASNSQNRIININNIISMKKTEDEFINDINIHSLDRIMQLSETIERPGSSYTTKIYHNDTRTAAQNKWEDIMGTPYNSFSGYMNKYKFNFVDINMNQLLGGQIKSLEETLESMRGITIEKQNLIKKLNNLKIIVDRFVNISSDVKIKLDDYMVVKKQLDNLKKEIEKLP